jgi:hypothetical protein
MTKSVPKKKPQGQKRGTLDQQHTNRIRKFEKKTNALPKKKRKLSELQAELAALNSKNPNKYSHDDVNRKAYLLDSVQKLKEEMHRIENCTDSLNYIVDVMPILIDYYDNKEIIDDGMEEELVSNGVGGKKNILTYFALEANKAKTAPLIAPPPPATKAQKSSVSKDKDQLGKKRARTEAPSKGPAKKVKSGSKTLAPKPEEPKAESKAEPKPKVSKAKLYESYLTVTDSTYRKTSTPCSSKCSDPDCPGEKIFCQNDGSLTCNICGISEATLTIMEKPNYKEPTQDSGTYAYKRINHLTEILSQLQAKESTDIPPKIFENILREIKKRKIDKNDLDIFRLRRILKRLGYIKLYEHAAHLLQVINGREPPVFTRTEEAKIKKLFKSIQEPFAIYCPKNRKNFLNYSYVLHKFCELLGLDEHISYFPLLKNNSKLLQHDRIWKSICKHMRWRFYPSI